MKILCIDHEPGYPLLKLLGRFRAEPDCEFYCWDGDDDSIRRIGTFEQSATGEILDVLWGKRLDPGLLLSNADRIEQILPGGIKGVRLIVAHIHPRGMNAIHSECGENVRFVRFSTEPQYSGFRMEGKVNVLYVGLPLDLSLREQVQELLRFCISCEKWPRCQSEMPPELQRLHPKPTPALSAFGLLLQAVLAAALSELKDQKSIREALGIPESISSESIANASIACPKFLQDAMGISPDRSGEGDTSDAIAKSIEADLDYVESLNISVAHTRELVRLLRDSDFLTQDRFLGLCRDSYEKEVIRMMAY